MSFYLKSPRGFTNIHQLEECISQRLACYELISGDNIQEVLPNYECLIEDSTLDRTGHYILRLVAFSNRTFRNIFIKKECRLLQERFKYLNDVESVKLFFKKLRQHASACFKQVEESHERIKEYYFVLLTICTQLLRKDCLKYTAVICEDETFCSPFVVKVPFYFCSDLVAKRAVDINLGYVQMDCMDWRTLFLSLFNTYLDLALKEMRYCPQVYNTLDDDRIVDIIDLVNKSYSIRETNGCIGDDNVTFKMGDFKEEAMNFPLCMQSLYGILQKNNRLSHNARFDFSLYMKGIGISMSDSVAFWENAYSKEHASCSKCTHNWQQNAKRYIYGIRHLYGLEGSRKNYDVKSCHLLQHVSLGATEEGGCPFSHFDDSHLRNVLKEQIPNYSDEIEVIIYSRKESPSRACKLFFESKLKSVQKVDGKNLEEKVFYNPVQFYFLMKNSLTS